VSESGVSTEETIEVDVEAMKKAFLIKFAKIYFEEAKRRFYFSRKINQ
jgi:hypothetical protein